MAAEKKQDGSIDLTMSDDDIPPTQPLSDSEPMAEDLDSGVHESKDVKLVADPDESDFDEEGEEFAQGSFR